MFNVLCDISYKYNIMFSIDYHKYEDFMVNLFNSETNINYNAIVENIKTNSLLRDDGMIYNILGLYNRFITHNYKEMELNYKLAIDKGNCKVYNNIADYHHVVTKNCKEMIKYFKLGSKMGDSSAMKNLGNYYSTIKNYKQMKYYYIMAIKYGSSAAMNDMGIYHQTITKNYTEMEKYYKLAIATGYYLSLINLGIYHEYITNNYTDMINYYCMYVKNIKYINNIADNKIDNKLKLSKYYIDIYCNLDTYNRTKLSLTSSIYEYEGRLQSHLNTKHRTQYEDTINNDSIIDNDINTCTICMDTDSTSELISWDCHKSHILCNRCYPRIRREGKCHMCRSNIT